MMSLFKKILSLRIRYASPAKENYFFILALHHTEWPIEKKKGWFLELFCRRLEVTYDSQIKAED